MARTKTTDSIIAAAVTLGGIFGLIADAPDVFDLAVKALAAPFTWLRQMNGAMGYWLLIVGGIASLAWIHFGRKIRSLWPARVERSTPVTHDDLVKLAHAIADSSEFASKIAKLSGDTAVQEMQFTLLRDVMPKITKAVDALDDIGGSIVESDRDLLSLLDFCTHNLTYRMLQAVRQKMPQDIVEYKEQPRVTEQWIKDQGGRANDYINHVLMELGATRWTVDLRNLIQHGEAEGDRYVSSIPTDERPADVDPYDFRQYSIAKAKYDYLIRFLQATAEEEEDNLSDYLTKLRERLKRRSS